MERKKESNQYKQHWQGPELGCVILTSSRDETFPKTKELQQQEKLLYEEWQQRAGASECYSDTEIIPWAGEVKADNLN
jgi:hypothetical protein